MHYQIVNVKSYCGYRPDEHPLAFDYDHRHWMIEQILDRWIESSYKAGFPNYAYFRVLTSEGEIFLLRYNTRFSTWAIKVE